MISFEENRGRVSCHLFAFRSAEMCTSPDLLRGTMPTNHLVKIEPSAREVGSVAGSSGQSRQSRSGPPPSWRVRPTRLTRPPRFGSSMSLHPAGNVDPSAILSPSEKRERKRVQKPLQGPHGKELVGSVVEVFWMGDRRWYRGVVRVYSELTGHHLVQYDDGEQRDEPLNDEELLWRQLQKRRRRAEPVSEPGPRPLGPAKGPSANKVFYRKPPTRRQHLVPDSLTPGHYGRRALPERVGDDCQAQLPTLHVPTRVLPPPAPPPRCRCDADTLWARGRWWCAADLAPGDGCGCGFESVPPPPSQPWTPLCACDRPAVWRHAYWWCDVPPSSTRCCGFEIAEVPCRAEPALVAHIVLEQEIARRTAAALTAAAYETDAEDDGELLEALRDWPGPVQRAILRSASEAAGASASPTFGSDEGVGMGMHAAEASSAALAATGAWTGADPPLHPTRHVDLTVEAAQRYPCPFPGCTRAFATTRKLGLHHRIIHERMPDDDPQPPSPASPRQPPIPPPREPTPFVSVPPAHAASTAAKGKAPAKVRPLTHDSAATAAMAPEAAPAAPAAAPLVAGSCTGLSFEACTGLSFEAVHAPEEACKPGRKIFVCSVQMPMAVPAGLKVSALVGEINKRVSFAIPTKPGTKEGDTRRLRVRLPLPCILADRVVLTDLILVPMDDNGTKPPGGGAAAKAPMGGAAAGASRGASSKGGSCTGSATNAVATNVSSINTGAAPMFMSVTELRRELLHEGVDISECIEKSDLVAALVDNRKRRERSPAIELD